MQVIYGALIGGAFGTVTALIGAWLSYRTAQRKRADDLFLMALEFMGGGSQRRNLGVAAITMYWRQFPEYGQLISEMLAASAIYLLTESKQKDASHEVFNLHRIMALLKETTGHTPIDTRLAKIVQNRIDQFEPKPSKGLWLDREVLKEWQHWLSL